MFTAKLVADLRNKPAGVPYIFELMRAVQRRRTEDNVIMNVLKTLLLNLAVGISRANKTLQSC